MSDKPLADVWADRDFPVLVEITRRFDEGVTTVPLVDVEQALGMQHETVQRAARALERVGLLETMGVATSEVLRVKNLHGKAYELTGLHPSPEAVADRLLASLDKAIDEAPEGDKKSRLKRAREALGAMGRDLLVDIAGGVIRGEIGP